MKLREQINCADQVVARLYGDTLPLFPRPATPLRFRDGWRVPYALYYVSEYGSFRLRHAMLVLFFKDEDIQNGVCNPIVEWDELKETAPHTRLENLRNFHSPQAIHFPSIGEVYQRVLANAAVKQIESLEMVLDDLDAALWQPYWRVNALLVDGTHKVFRINVQTSEVLEDSSPALSKRRYATAEWSLVRTTSCDSAGRLQIRLPNTSDESVIRKRLELVAWTCQHAIAEFFRELGHGELDMHDILIEYNLAQHARCHTDPVDHLSVITLSPLGDDPSIVLHEFAHALWYLFYVRSPTGLALDAILGAGWAHGIEEGFADYFAGTLLMGEQHRPFTVAGNSTNEGPPRTITGIPLPPPVKAADQHVVGEQWANALWNLREHLRGKRIPQTEIDRLILYAHFKPPQLAQVYRNPFACYYTSLQITAQDMGLQSDFAEWVFPFHT